MTWESRAGCKLVRRRGGGGKYDDDIDLVVMVKIQGFDHVNLHFWTKRADAVLPKQSGAAVLTIAWLEIRVS